MSSLGERIRELRLARRLTAEQLATKAGISQGAISQVENGITRTVAGDNLVRIARALGTSAEYLMLGLKSRTTGTLRYVLPYTGAGADLVRTPTSEQGRENAGHDIPEFVLIPTANALIIGHPGKKKQQQMVDFADPIAVRSDWLKRKGLSTDKLVAIDVPDESMADRLNEGDTVIVDLSQTDLIEGRVYAVSYRETIRMRRVFLLPDAGFILTADNPRFPEITIQKDQARTVKVLGRVVPMHGTL